MINGLDIYYSKKVGQGLKPISNKKTASGLKPISKQTQKADGLKPISKGKGCKQIYGKGLKILQ